MNDLVSVVVPIFNTEKYLDRCIFSIESQTYEHLEILLIDDGSEDNSGEKCENYKKDNDKIRVFHTPNLGVSHARNIGIKEAKGKFITFIDSDDYVDAEMVEALLENMIVNDSDLSISSFAEEVESENLHVTLEPQDREKILFLSKRYLIFGPTQKMYKTEIVKNISFPEGISYGEDLLFNIEYLKKIKSVSFLNKNYYYYCQNNNGLSTKTRWNMFDNDMFLHKALQEWYEKIGIFNGDVEVFLYDRVFDTAVNSICMTFRNDCSLSFLETTKLIKRIILDDTVQKSVVYANTNKYARWQPSLIKHKSVITLSIIAMVERIFNG